MCHIALSLPVHYELSSLFRLFLSLISFLHILLSLLAHSLFFLFPSYCFSPASLPLYSSIMSISFLSTYFAPLLSIPLLNLNALFSSNALFFLTSCLHPSWWPCVTPGRIITLGWNIGSVAPYSALSARIIHLWSIPFCGEPSSYSPVMIGVLATLCICTVI